MIWEPKATQAELKSKRKFAFNMKQAFHMARRFRKEEDGAMVILSLFVFLVMLLMAGLGIDTMRHEMERTHLQATLDSAVLAGAGQPQGATVEDIRLVVEDYFDKNQMSQFLRELDTDGVGEDDIVTSLNSTRVFAEANMTIDTYLLQLSGIETLSTSGAAEAVVRTPKLEISVVLDVSGSMRGQKLTNLQTAARSFVTTILDNSDDGNTAISLVPFAWTVTPGEDIFNALTVDQSHDFSTCLRFSGSDYLSPAIDPNISYPQQIFTSDRGSFRNLNDDFRSCFPESNAEILAYSKNEQDLHNHINALTASGNTSAHIGMKWGAALLDPEFDSVVETLQEENVVDAGFSNLPAVYGEAETLKVIILMADGVNTNSYYFNDISNFRGPNSTFFSVRWRDGGRERQTYFIRVGDFFLDVENRRFQPDTFGPFPESQGIRLSDGRFFVRLADLQNFLNFDNRYIEDSLDRLDWEEAWALIPPTEYSRLTRDFRAVNEYRGGSNFESGFRKDTRMQSICTATKNEGVVVYTIGYEIAQGGNAERQLQNCASSLNHYFPTDGADISAAFNSIASNVQNLRLTQ